jgi:hypothetical protein
MKQTAVQRRVNRFSEYAVPERPGGKRGISGLVEPKRLPIDGNEARGCRER